MMLRGYVHTHRHTLTRATHFSFQCAGYGETGAWSYCFKMEGAWLASSCAFCRALWRTPTGFKQQEGAVCCVVRCIEGELMRKGLKTAPVKKI